jgi:hypothetical protein
VEPGNYKITIAASGFAVWTATNVAVASSDSQPLLSAVLQVAAASSSVNVTLSQHELATEQLKTEEKQRLLGVLPDFFVSYAPNAAPLTAAQKFQLGWKTIIDPWQPGIDGPPRTFLLSYRPAHGFVSRDARRRERFV